VSTLTALKPHEQRSLFVLFITGLLFWTSIGILLPTLPAYLNAIGTSNQQIGIIIGAFAVGLLTMRPLLGKWADTRGRKFVLLIGTLVVAIAPGGYLILTSMPLLVLLRAFHGISIAAFTTAYSALVVDISPLKQRGEIIGYMSLVSPIGVAIGPAIGGYLLQGGNNYAPIFGVSILCGAISCLGAYQIPNSSPRGLQPDLATREERKIARSIPQILTNPALGIPALVLLLIGFPFGALHTFIPLYIQASNIDFNPGLFYTIAAMSSFSARLIIGSKSDRYGRGIFIAASLCAYTLAMTCLATARGEIGFIFGAVLEGLGVGILIPMTIALISDRVSPQQRGQALSVCTAGLDLGMAIAAPLFGAVADILNYRGIFTVGTGLAMVALLVFLTAGNRGLKPSLAFACGRDRDYHRLDR
jgi:MFS family permease